MLKGIHPLLSPDLLYALAAMGHGDRIAVVDANFPALGLARRSIVLAGATAPDVLAAILSVLPIDDFAPDPVSVMQVVGDAAQLPETVQEFIAILATHNLTAPAQLDRQIGRQPAIVTARKAPDVVMGIDADHAEASGGTTPLVSRMLP